MHNSCAKFSNSYMYDSFLLLTTTCFLPCVHDRCDVINSQLLHILRFATVKFKIMLLTLSLSAYMEYLIL